MMEREMKKKDEKMVVMEREMKEKEEDIDNLNEQVKNLTYSVQQYGIAIVCNKSWGMDGMTCRRK